VEEGTTALLLRHTREGGGVEEGTTASHQGGGGVEEGTTASHQGGGVEEGTTALQG
jgi:hypothetical protein